MAICCWSGLEGLIAHQWEIQPLWSSVVSPQQVRWLSHHQCLWLCFVAAVVSLCCCTVCFCAVASEVNDNISPTVMNGSSWGAISVDIDPNFWWVLFTDNGYCLSLLGIVIICSLLKVRYLRANDHCWSIPTGVMVSAIHMGITDIFSLLVAYLHVSISPFSFKVVATL